MKHFWPVLLLAGCPSAPSPEAPEAHENPKPLVVLAERTRKPVQAQISTANDMARLEAPGFLVREQPVVFDEALLWEDDATLPYYVTEDLLYQGHALQLPETAMLSYDADPELMRSAHFRNTLHRAVEIIESQTPYGLDFGTDDFIRFERSRNGWFLAWLTYDGDVITHIRIEVGEERRYPGQHYLRALVHEIAHAFGLEDCHLGRGIMCAPWPVQSFSPEERELLRKSRTRRPGNALPDSDPGKVWAHGVREVQVCRAKEL